MPTAHMPSTHRQLCYLSDEAAREQAEAIAQHDDVAAQFAIRALAIWCGAAIGSLIAATVSACFGA